MFDEFADVDDTPACYLTSVLICVCSVYVSVKLFQNETQSDHRIGYFFVCTALSFFSSFLQHLIIHKHDTLEDMILRRTTFFFYGLGTISLNLFWMKLIGIYPDHSSTVIKAIWYLVLVVSCGIVVVDAVMNLVIANAMFGSLVTAVIFILYVRHIFYEYEEMSQRTLFKVKAAGVGIIIAGMAVQVILEGPCGQAGYKDCFESCPLDPLVFNHNAIFHFMYAIGVMIWGLSEAKSPSIKLSREQGIPLEKSDKQ